MGLQAVPGRPHAFASLVVKLTRAITPRQVIDRHLPVVAFFILLWIGLGQVQRHLCALHQIACS